MCSPSLTEFGLERAMISRPSTDDLASLQLGVDVVFLVGQVVAKLGGVGGFQVLRQSGAPNFRPMRCSVQTV